MFTDPRNPERERLLRNIRYAALVLLALVTLAVIVLSLRD